jgi:hypothetical protein
LASTLHSTSRELLNVIFVGVETMSISKLTALACSTALMAAVSLAPSSARASYSCSAGVCSGSLDTGVIATDFDTSLAFPLFDESLGTLNSVTVTLTGWVDVFSSTVHNTSGAAVATTISETSRYAVSDTTSPGGALNSLLAALLINPSFTEAYTGVNKIAAGATVAFGPANTPGAVTMTAPSPDALSAFEAPSGGTHSLDVSTLTGDSIVGNSGNVVVTTSTNGQLTIGVTYDYTASDTPSPVPEPASLLVIGSGLAALGLIRRRKV